MIIDISMRPNADSLPAKRRFYVIDVQLGTLDDSPLPPDIVAHFRTGLCDTKEHSNRMTRVLAMLFIVLRAVDEYDANTEPKMDCREVLLKMLNGGRIGPH